MTENIRGGKRPSNVWPELPFEAWKDTCETLHLWTQIIGKIRLAQMEWINHSWHVTLTVTARGLTTMPMPYGSRVFQIDFDFIDHRLNILTTDGATRVIPLRPMSVATFYRQVFDALNDLGLDIRIHGSPNELVEAIPFEEDEVHAAYDPVYANRFWLALTQTERVFQQFRSRFGGKVSPIQFFWGSFDLAVTRFSYETAPVHPGGIPNLPDWVTREAYSHEVSSAGFWPGSESSPTPFFYSYAYPEPEGYSQAAIEPDAASYSDTFREFILPYDAVRTAAAPDATLLAFLQSTYDAAANLGQWDRALLDCELPPPDARPTGGD
ncbi:MAG: hypothetical protein KA586_01195 [Candidatus Promineofilum sp.]|nr:hypothetical protein [Promineifilum sp.]